MAHAKIALRLALCVLLSAGVAAAAQTQDDKASAEAEKKEVKNFVLTTDKLDKYDAAVKAVHKVQKDNPAIKKQMDDDDSRNPSNTIAGSVATIEKYPPIAKAIKRRRPVSSRFRGDDLHVDQFSGGCADEESGNYQGIPGLSVAGQCRVR